jgi:hypothetical protein
MGNYYVRVFEHTTKDVRCESCGCEFAYHSVQSAIAPVGLPRPFGGRPAWERTVEKARNKAAGKAAQLLDTPDLVACPECGWYQDHMVRHLRKRRLRKVLLAAFSVLPFFWLVFTTAIRINAFRFGVVLFALVAMALAVAAAWQVIRDPNANASEFDRKSRAGASEAVATRTVLRAAREAAVAEQESGDDLTFLYDHNQSLGLRSEVKQKRERHERQRRDERRRLLVPTVAVGGGAVIGAILAAILFGTKPDDLPMAIVGGLFAGIVGGCFGMLAASRYLALVSRGDCLDHSSDRQIGHLPHSLAAGSTVAWITAALIATPLATGATPAKGYGCALVVGTQVVFLVVSLRLTRPRGPSELDRH